jgi:nucleoside 2-deoxyribosyltransferase
MKIYVAGSNQDEANAVAAILISEGHVITARWLLKPFNRTETHTVPERMQIAKEDVEDVLAADCLIMLSSSRRVSGGKFVELGVALGANKLVCLIGERENMLMWHPSIQHFVTIEDALPVLAKE